MSGGAHLFDIYNNAWVYGEVTVGTSPVELKVGANVLDQRQGVLMVPLDSDIYFGSDSSVTTSNGIILHKRELIIVPIGYELSVYMIAASSGKKVRIGEFA